jgi:hypothetical protein
MSAQRATICVAKRSNQNLRLVPGILFADGDLRPSEYDINSRDGGERSDA